jgi:hypothetical protein
LVNGYLIDLDRIPKEKFRNRIYWYFNAPSNSIYEKQR